MGILRLVDDVSGQLRGNPQLVLLQFCVDVSPHFAVRLHRHLLMVLTWSMVAQAAATRQTYCSLVTSLLPTSKRSLRQRAREIEQLPIDIR